MLELILIRHARSIPFGQGSADFERTLIESGVQDAARMGRRLTELQLKADLILTSPARRAKQTAQLFAREMQYPENDVREVEAFYNAEADTLLAEIQRIVSTCKHLALVAHNPGISWLYRLLANESVDMPTCAVAVIHFDLDDWQAVHADVGWSAHFEYPAKLPEP
ncbi:hypothetical protein MNBD_GAMMA15-1822 [hydrothermal vent metagenome]|uniref:Phosphohistidine phosphatase SixA n=1 Tax=hydrothermal vent metagenome TaxID=652676 RepID=A0A3B0YVA6_9ZZZZ